MDVDAVAVRLVSWLATYAIHSTIIFVAAWLVTRSLSARFDRLAESIWKSALVLSVMSPLLQTMLPAATPGPSVFLADALPGTGSVVGRGGLELSWPVVIASIWIAAGLIGVLTLLSTRQRVARQMAGSQLLDRAARKALLGECAECDSTIGVSDLVSVPVAFGRLVYLPSWTLHSLSSSQLRSIVAHEAAHIARRDSVWRWVSALSARVFFFQPFNWVVARRLRELAECLCDEDAVTRTGSPLELAAALRTFAGSLTVERESSADLVLSLASRQSLTLRRVARMLTATPSPIGPAPVRAVLTASTTMLLVSTAFAPRVEPLFGPADVYTVQASDPAGPFTLTIKRGRVISASVAGRELPRERLRQNGRKLQLAADGSPPFSVTLTPKGGITWAARRTSSFSF